MNATDILVLANTALAVVLLVWFAATGFLKRRTESSRPTCTVADWGACSEPVTTSLCSGAEHDGGRTRGGAPTNKDENTVTKLDTGAAGIDLSGKRRETFALTLPNGKVLHLYTPTKAVANLFADIGEILQRTAKGRATPEDSAELYRLAALLLGNNAERAAVDAQELFVNLTLDDIADVLTAYMDWLTALIESKN